MKLATDRIGWSNIDLSIYPQKFVDITRLKWQVH